MKGVRLRLLVLVSAVTLGAGTPSAVADEVSVPIDLQVALLGRVLRYERTYASETTPVQVLVVSRSGSPASVRVGSQLTAALRRSGSLGGRAVSVTPVSYTTAAALRASANASRARVVYLAAGLGDQLAEIDGALTDRDLFLVSTVGPDVERGAVIGFELVSSRPRIIVNLRAARARRLQFNGQFLRLARVVQ